MSATTDTFARFIAILTDTMDDHEASSESMASRVHLSRFYFDRLISAAAGEPPAAMRRRVLLERAAYRRRCCVGRRSCSPNVASRWTT